jgi:hypothetical protein
LSCRGRLVLLKGGRRAEQLGELDEVDGFGEIRERTMIQEAATSGRVEALS